VTVTKIDGSRYHQMLCSAAASLEQHKEEINSMNVFPVPDGDTGSNMSMTLDAVKKLPANSNLASLAETAAKEIMRAARGNSGVILSLFFRGMAKAFAGYEEADAAILTNAFRTGAEEARKAVFKPVEGTILTVMRECCSSESDETDLCLLADQFCLHAQETLKKTPDMLPALKRAHVVDAGGFGFTAVLDGMRQALNNEPVESWVENYSAANFDEFEEEEINFTFCTECIIAKNGPIRIPDSLRTFLADCGDSIVLTDDDEIIKLHVHTNDPFGVLQQMTALGELQFSKVENMKLQHQHIEVKKADKKTEKKAPAVTQPMNQYAILAVSNGDGISNVFRDLGANIIISGGQSMNPSVDDFLKALRNIPNKNAIILPNNSNIVLTANQAARLSDDVHVEVIRCKTIPQGISALLSFNDKASPETNVENMMEAVENVVSLAVTRAVKNADTGLLKVRKRQYIGLVDNDLKYAADEQEDCIRMLAEEIRDREIITVYYGKEVKKNEAERAVDILQEELGEYAEIQLVNGQQPIYDYLISAE